MDSSRAALHAMLDQLPDEVLPRVASALAMFAENDALSAHEEELLEAGFRSMRQGRLHDRETVFAKVDAMLRAKAGR